jgi:hypothetical protein
MKRKACFPFSFPSFFINFAAQSAKLLCLGMKNESIHFVLLSTFCNFAPDLAMEAAM